VGYDVLNNNRARSSIDLMRMFDTESLLRFIPVLASLSLVFTLLGTSSASSQTTTAECKKNPKLCANSTGEITVGTPRIWRYSRVYPLLDGLLRDFEAMQVNSMSGDKALDPLASNNSSVTMLQQMTRAGVSYDQTIGLTNSWAVQDRQAKIDDLSSQRTEYETSLKSWNTNHDQLIAQRTQLSSQQNAAKAKLYDDKRLTVDPADSENGKKELGAVDADQKIVDSIQNDLNANATDITNLGTAPQRPEALAASGLTSAQAASTLKTADSSPISSTLGQLPDDVKSALKSQIAKAVVIPPSLAMQKQSTLLYERLALMLGVTGDDVSRSSNKQIYLLGFDIGLYPSPAQKDRIARVAYTITGIDDKSAACAVYATKLLPDMSALNIADYDFSSTGFNFSAVVKLFNGFGGSADYQRLKEQMHSGVSQAAYVSGFGTGLNTFGWYFGTAPFERRVSPGSRTVYAFVLADGTCTPTLKYTAYWMKRDGGGTRGQDVVAANESLSTSFPPADSGTAKGGVKIEAVSYVPTVLTSVAADSYGTLQIDLKEDIDPNLIITVGGTTLKRVRDWRGRATVPSSSEKSASSDPALQVPFGRGLLEADNLAPDTWIAPTPRTLLISVKASTAGNSFPAIRLLSGGTGTDVLSSMTSLTQLRVGNITATGTPPRSAFLPLVYAIPDGSSSNKLVSAMYSPLNADVMQVRLTGLDSNGRLLALSPLTQVSIKAQTEDTTESLETFLACTSSQGELICTLPKRKLSELCVKESKNRCDAAPYPKLIAVQAVVQSYMSASTEFNPNDRPVPYVKSSMPISVSKTTSGDFDKWTFTATFGGLCAGAKNPKATLSNGSALSGTMHGSQNTYSFDITTANFKLLTDDMPLQWSCDDPKDSEAGTDIVGLAKLLTPQVTSIAMNGAVLRGKFSGVTGLRVNSDAVVEDAVASDTSIYPKKGYPAKGLLYLMVGTMPVPAMLQGDQIVIEQTGPANDPHLAIAGAQTAPPSGGGVPSGANAVGSANNPPKVGDSKTQTPEEIAAAKDDANKKAALEAATKQTTLSVQIVTNK
jgi:hypothetical protein